MSKGGLRPAFSFLSIYLSYIVIGWIIPSGSFQIPATVTTRLPRRLPRLPSWLAAGLRLSTS